MSDRSKEMTLRAHHGTDRLDFTRFDIDAAGKSVNGREI